MPRIRLGLAYESLISGIWPEFFAKFRCGARTCLDRGTLGAIAGSYFSMRSDYPLPPSPVISVNPPRGDGASAPPVRPAFPRPERNGYRKLPCGQRRGSPRRAAVYEHGASDSGEINSGRLVTTSWGRLGAGALIRTGLTSALGGGAFPRERVPPGGCQQLRQVREIHRGPTVAMYSIQAQKTSSRTSEHFPYIASRRRIGVTSARRTAA